LNRDFFGADSGKLRSALLTNESELERLANHVILLAVWLNHA